MQQTIIFYHVSVKSFKLYGFSGTLYSTLGLSHSCKVGCSLLLRRLMLFPVKIYIRNEPFSSSFLRSLSISRCPRGWYNVALVCDRHDMSFDRAAAQRAALSGKMRLVREKSSGER